MTLAVLLLVSACGVAPSRQDALAQFGAACHPDDVTDCRDLWLYAGGWCADPTNGVAPQCVLPCGPDCEALDGVCSTEGVCFRLPASEAQDVAEVSAEVPSAREMGAAE